ncbi:rhodopsin-like orphan GPCR [Schistosoma japonicum]|uniref:Rhodopsin-like orphan GPCR n=1 Tax=Schistosoma japonicum TaxID=6182 RepID=A0A4Z2CVE9_SCHJA|nr:rhodopsin-like orphan GPCR [Schistosoma japonicum]
MSSTNQTNLQFSFTFYYTVHYLGLCENITDPNKYGKPMTLPEKWQQIPLICLSSIAFLFNALSLFVFLFGEFTINRKMSTSQLQETKTMTKTTSSRTTTLSKCKSRKHGYSRSSFLTSLIILSTFEVIFNLSVVIYKLIEVFSPYFIHQIPLDSIKHIPPDMKLIIIPVLQNIIMFFGDVGLMCRNWCICLITAARAEVVIWPLGSKSWQRYSTKSTSIHDNIPHAIHKRHQGQIRATRVVLVVAILFGLLECMNFIISICQTSKLLTNKRLSRILETIGNTLITLDSICNFLVFISMMSYFRHLFIKIFLCKEMSSNVNHNSSSVSQKATSCTSINQTCTTVVENTLMK